MGSDPQPSNIPYRDLVHLFGHSCVDSNSPYLIQLDMTGCRGYNLTRVRLESQSLRFDLMFFMGLHIQLSLTLLSPFRLGKTFGW